MIFLGILLLCGGGGLAIYGNSLNNSFEARWDSFWTNGNTDPGTTYIIIGIVLGVIGIILLIYGLSKNSNESTNIPSQTITTQSSTPNTPRPYIKVDGCYLCRSCGNKQTLTNG